MSKKKIEIWHVVILVVAALVIANSQGLNLFAMFGFEPATGFTYTQHTGKVDYNDVHPETSENTRTATLFEYEITSDYYDYYKPDTTFPAPSGENAGQMVDKFRGVGYITRVNKNGIEIWEWPQEGELYYRTSYGRTFPANAGVFTDGSIKWPNAKATKNIVLDNLELSTVGKEIWVYTYDQAYSVVNTMKYTISEDEIFIEYTPIEGVYAKDTPIKGYVSIDNNWSYPLMGELTIKTTVTTFLGSTSSKTEQQIIDVPVGKSTFDWNITTNVLGTVKITPSIELFASTTYINGVNGKCESRFQKGGVQSDWSQYDLKTYCTHVPVGGLNGDTQVLNLTETGEPPAPKIYMFSEDNATLECVEITDFGYSSFSECESARQEFIDTGEAPPPEEPEEPPAPTGGGGGFTPGEGEIVVTSEGSEETPPGVGLFAISEYGIYIGAVVLIGIFVLFQFTGKKGGRKKKWF